MNTDHIEVVLGICKNCGRVEVELDEPCDHRNLIASLRAENARMKAQLATSPRPLTQG